MSLASCIVSVVHRMRGVTCGAASSVHSSTVASFLHPTGVIATPGVLPLALRRFGVVNSVDDDQATLCFSFFCK